MHKAFSFEHQYFRISKKIRKLFIYGSLEALNTQKYYWHESKSLCVNQKTQSGFLVIFMEVWTLKTLLNMFTSNSNIIAITDMWRFDSKDENKKQSTNNEVALSDVKWNSESYDYVILKF